MSQVTKETELLKHYFDNQQIDEDKIDVGLELEYHLLDQKMNPYFINLDILNKIDKDLLVPEAVKSVVEANSDFYSLKSNGLRSLYNYLSNYWQACHQAVKDQGGLLCGIGTLPTYTDKGLIDHNITPKKRYQVMVQSIDKKRYNPNRLMSLEGKQVAFFRSNSVNFMGPTNALHIHLRVPFKNHVDYYNASLIASGFLIASASNSLYFLSKELWHESRIFIFEHLNYLLRHTKMPRVFLGDKYLENSFLDLYQQNLAFLPLLYDLKSDIEDPFWHLKNHSSTIWRWNRPVIDIKENKKIHLRIENRVLPASPSVIDTAANTAFDLPCEFGTVI
ncbi:hypothetical protein L3V86_08915 [Thiotrichales bacterium 19S11-10]|nr:hypothetical protein [Thiotrichales bacterium 19S11-10]